MHNDGQVRDTLVEKDRFQLTLPGRWHAVPAQDENSFAYQCEGHEEQLTVSLFFSDHEMQDAEQGTVVEHMIAHRQRAERELSEDSVEVSTAGYGQEGEVVAGRYTAYEAPNRRSATLVLCGPWTVAVFFYEALNQSQETFENRARLIMNSIVLR